MDQNMIIAAIAALPATIAACAAWRNSYKTKAATKSSNGKFLAAYVEGIADDTRETRSDVKELFKCLAAHIGDSYSHQPERRRPAGFGG